MTLHLNRRSLLGAGMFGVGALAAPGTAHILAAQGFTHQVASGEPGPDSVLLWTRFVAPNGDGRLRVEIAEDTDFGRIVARGETVAQAEADHTAKLTIAGLAPDKWYFYRFIAADGTVSPVGRTRTLPEGPVGRFAIGVFSCSNMPFGYFNAYAHAAARGDLDLIVHTGDYLYEYERGRYPDADLALAGRIIEPANEILALADYRLRYASYRADPDLAALHRNFPMIAGWDDHELANDAWSGGAENHNEGEGDWATRKRIAERVYREWMPVSDAPWASYQIGMLATLMRVETRATARDKQLAYADVARNGGSDLARALREFRDGAWSAEDRTILGQEQESWLHRELIRSVSNGTRWQVLAQQVVMGPIHFPLALADEIISGGSEEARRRVGLLAAAAREGLPLNLDAWDGYPAARNRLLASALDAQANLVVLSGDSHNGWAFNLELGDMAAGVEMAGNSVTSPGFEGALPGFDPASVASAVREVSPGLQWADTSNRGYLTVILTNEYVRGDWYLLDTVRERSTKMRGLEIRQVNWGANAFEDV